MGQLLWIGSLFAILIAYMAYNIITLFELFKNVHEVNKELCQVVKGAVGIEDLVRFNNYLIGGSDERGKLWHLKDFLNGKTPSGKMIYVDTNISKIEKIEIKTLPMNNFPSNVSFHPHGTYVYKDKYLYVINHAYDKGGERVEVFEVLSNRSGLELNYLRSIVYPSKFAGNFNDLAVIGDNDEILLTTWLPFSDDPVKGRELSKLRELLTLGLYSLKIKLTDVYYCKKDNCSKVEGTSSLMNNGITYDLNNTVYVADTAERKIKIYRINRNNTENILEYTSYIDVNYAIDNIEYDSSSSQLYVGVLGKVIDYFKMVENFKKQGNLTDLKAFGGAVIIDTKNSNKVELVTMQEDFLGIASAHKAGNMIYHGSWVDNGLLICKIK